MEKRLRMTAWPTMGVVFATSFLFSVGSLDDVNRLDNTQLSNLLGDVNQSGSVTAIDATITLQYVVGAAQLTDAQVNLADVSGNGTVSSLDASLILRRVVDTNYRFPRQDMSYPLAVTIQGEGSVDEAVISTKSEYQYGTAVRLTARADEGWKFSGWSGDISGTDTSVTIMVDVAKNVTATFERNPPFVSYAEQFSAINQTTGYVSNLNTFVNYIGLEEASYITDNLLEGKYLYPNKDAVTYDFDGDGHLDLFFFGMRSSIFGGENGYHENGKYFFIPDYYNQSKPYEYIKYDSMIEFAAGGIDLQDIDGDGLDEILIFNTNTHQANTRFIGNTVNQPRELGVVVLHVNQEFEITDENEIGIPKPVHKGTSGDVDNDGDIDIINFPIGAPINKTVFEKFPTTMLNDGNGNFLEELSITDEYIYIDYYQVESTMSNLFDIDGDGYLDLVFSRNLGNFYNEFEEYFDIIWGLFILWGDGTGYFSFDNGINLNNNNELDVTMTPLGSAFSDYDNDGDIDLIITSTIEYDEYIITLFENKGNREFTDVTEDKIEGYFSFDNSHAINLDGELMSIDKNQDGLYDLVPKGFKVFCCMIEQYPNLSNNLWWENVGGKYVRRVED